VEASRRGRGELAVSWGDPGPRPLAAARRGIGGGEGTARARGPNSKQRPWSGARVAFLGRPRWARVVCRVVTATRGPGVRRYGPGSSSKPVIVPVGCLLVFKVLRAEFRQICRFMPFKFKFAHSSVPLGLWRRVTGMSRALKTPYILGGCHCIALAR
jgi:hypothetical protein